MLALKVPLKDAEKAKIMLRKKDLFDKNYQYKKDKEFIYFPIKKKFSSSYEIVDINLIKRKETVCVKKEFKKRLAEKQKEKLRTGIDIIGDIAVVEISKEIVPKQKLFAELLMKNNPGIKTVLKKLGGHEGEFRVQKTVHLLGKRKKTTIHKENGIRLFVDIDKVYFSPRSAHERMRIASQVKKSENILVMFSGIAPLPCVLSKNTKANKIIGIELNKVAHEIGLKNVEMNKLHNVELIHGDVKKIIPKLKMKFERIAMPLPRTANEFLQDALKVSKKGTIIHLYNFLKEEEFADAKKKILDICKKNNVKAKVLRIVKAGQQSPRTFRICMDIKVLEI